MRSKGRHLTLLEGWCQPLQVSDHHRQSWLAPSVGAQRPRAGEATMVGWRIDDGRRRHGLPYAKRGLLVMTPRAAAAPPQASHGWGVRVPPVWVDSETRVSSFSVPLSLCRCLFFQEAHSLQRAQGCTCLHPLQGTIQVVCCRRLDPRMVGGNGVYFRARAHLFAYAVGAAGGGRAEPAAAGRSLAATSHRASRPPGAPVEGPHFGESD